MKSRSQKGFSAIEFLIIVASLTVVGFVGYMVYDRQQNDKTANSDISQASDVLSAPEINDTNDLDSAEAILDQTDTSNTSDTAELDDHLNSF